MKRRKKVIVVGSGAGGAVIADRLQDTCDVTILEQGGEFSQFKEIDRFAAMRGTGLFLDPRMIQTLIPNMQVRKSEKYRRYDIFHSGACAAGVPGTCDRIGETRSGLSPRGAALTSGMVGKSESMVMVNGVGIGGTTTLATGNAVRMDRSLKEIGVDLDAQFEELYSTLPITTEHEKYWNPATRELFRLFQEKGLDPQPTPKFLRTPECANCGLCAIGCPAGFKWDTRSLIESAVAKGARLITDCCVKAVDINGAEAAGVLARQGKKKYRFRADAVVLAAGGFGTPVILENAGIPCENTLFVDPVLCVAGVRKDFHQDRQLLMPFYSAQDGYMLSPYIDYLSFFFDKKWRYPRGDIVSLMVKMADESGGSSTAKKISKPLTPRDEERLRRGTAQCREILAEMGIPEKDTFLGILNAGHPGGMLALNASSAGSLHDSRLPENLYVADATILPEAAGLPPILTIMALSLKVAEKMKETLL